MGDMISTQLLNSTTCNSALLLGKYLCYARACMVRNACEVGTRVLCECIPCKCMCAHVVCKCMCARVSVVRKMGEACVARVCVRQYARVSVGCACACVLYVTCI